MNHFFAAADSDGGNFDTTIFILISFQYSMIFNLISFKRVGFPRNGRAAKSAWMTVL